MAKWPGETRPELTRPRADSDVPDVMPSPFPGLRGSFLAWARALAGSGGRGHNMNILRTPVSGFLPHRPDAGGQVLSGLPHNAPINGVCGRN